MRCLALLLLLTLSPAAIGLEPDNLLLITNKNMPEGRKLAEFYAQQRKVPDKRILELDLPAAEEMTFDAYEKEVVPAVREFLAANALGTKVTCLVTFYGVPLKIAARVNSAADQAERAALQQEVKAALQETAAAVQAVEALAREIDPAFAPGADQTLQGLTNRDKAARGVIGKYALQFKNPRSFEAFMSHAESTVAPLVGAALQAQQRMQALAIIAEKWTPAQKLEAETIREQLVQMRARFENLQAHRGDALARSQLRALVKEQLGLIEYVRVLEGMIDYFTTDGTGAAFDSEAALLRWNFYPRGRWLANPLCFHQAHSEHPPVCMTMRLDGPQPGIVRDLITASIKAEAQGLQGKAVVDSGGNLTIDAKSASYAAFDQTLRRLAEIIRTKSRVPLVFDQKPEVLPAHSVNQAALYCGWYALRNYTPGCTFTPGAVGYHVASFELTTLRSEGSREWCRGLLLDGIAATLGAVSEPFLNAFPPPDEFFPLLLTGKLPLAEVYWKTCPMVSWQIAMIGDPLYNPYKSDPALAIEALSPPLREAVR